MTNANFANRTMWTGDNLNIMRGMNSACVDLIYLDPPFNSKRDYAAPIGSKAAGAEFKDTWSLEDVDVEWINLMESSYPAMHRVLLAAMTDSDKSYLAYMAIRLLEMKRILKPTGTLYLHCDPTMSHYLKLLTDSIFGRKNFRNEIVWFYPDSPGRSAKYFPKKHDVIICYGNGGEAVFNGDDVRIPLKAESIRRYQSPRTIGGKTYLGGEGASKGKIPEDVWQIPVVKKHRGSKEATGYPTQKPLALLNRIVKASSNEGDLVLDPFCGCATTLVAADDLGRSWTGIDISPKAAELVVSRIQERQGLFRDIVHRKDIPKRTDLGELPRPAAHKKTLYGEQEGYCAGCAVHFEMRNLEVDHIIAKSKGGTDHIDNLQLLCPDCNRKKGSRGMEYLRTRLRLGIQLQEGKSARRRPSSFPRKRES